MDRLILADSSIMKTSPIARSITAIFALLLFCMVCSMACLAGLTVYTLRSIAHGQKQHADSFVPAKRFTAGFEREMLNARIHFIYFVTIQKPGTLEKGWERYHNAEAKLKDMAALIDQHSELENLREPVAGLRKDVANYGVALAATLAMVQGGELKGPHYDAQVKEWAARGATMVTDAASVESLCFKSSEANTNDIAMALKQGETHAIFTCAGGLLLCFLVMIAVVHHLNKLVVGNHETSPAMEVPGAIFGAGSI